MPLQQHCQGQENQQNQHQTCIVNTPSDDLPGTGLENHYEQAIQCRFACHKSQPMPGLGTGSSLKPMNRSMYLAGDEDAHAISA